jgi:hypothetical protein
MLFQQNGKIEVIIRKQEDAGQTLPEQEGNGETPPEDGGNSGSYWGGLSKSRKQRILKTNATQIIATAKQVGLQMLHYSVGLLSSQHGDSHYQDSVQRSWEIADDAFSIVSSVAMGATYGSWGGPIGTIVGIATNTTSTLASIGFKYANREKDLNIQQFKENNGIQYQRARAGINLTTGRLR